MSVWVFGLGNLEWGIFWRGTAESLHGEGWDGMEVVGGMADFGAFDADGGGGGGFLSGGPTIPASGGVLGADYNPSGYAIVVGSGVDDFVAEICWNGTGSGGWHDRRNPPWDEPYCIWD